MEAADLILYAETKQNQPPGEKKYPRYKSYLTNELIKEVDEISHIDTNLHILSSKICHFCCKTARGIHRANRERVFLNDVEIHTDPIIVLGKMRK